MSNTNNLHQRILAVMKAVPYIQKDATVDAGSGRSYKGVTHDAVVGKLRGPMIENGIVLSVNQTSDKSVDGQTKQGHPKIRYEAWYEVTLTNADNPEDRMTMHVQAHAEDGGDKAPGKAMSYATKTALLKAFALETGENDESRFQPEEVAYITSEQLANIKQLLEDTETDASQFANWLGVESIEAMPAAKYERARKALVKKAEKMDKAHSEEATE